MNIKKYILAFTVGLLGLSSCSKFGDINTDPNNLSIKETSFFLLRAEMSVPYFNINDTYNPWTQVLPGYFAEPRNFQFSSMSAGLLKFSTGDLYRIPIDNCQMIVDIVNDKKASGTVSLGGGLNNQEAVAQTLMAYFYMHMTDALGMLPYTEALGALKDNLTPKYDTMKEIYDGLDAKLNDAYKKFDTSMRLNPTYDVIYDGDISKWKKLNASLRMMMAIKLADVDPGTGKQRFVKAFNDGGLETDGTAEFADGDTFAFKYLKENDNANLLYKNIVIDGRRDFAPSNYVIDNYLKLDDPRVATIATPANGTFIGCVFGKRNTAKVKFSEFTPKYYEINTPAEVITAAHIKLIQAEAALRGWIPGSVTDYYAAGIKESFMNYGVSSDMSLDGLNKDLADKLRKNSDVNTYLAQSAVALVGDKEADLKKIAMQRWLNNYLKDGEEAWADLRRLDWPKILPGPDADANKLPNRMLYHSDDYDANKKNYEAAIKVQPDNIETKLWWDTK